MAEAGSCAYQAPDALWTCRRGTLVLGCCVKGLTACACPAQLHLESKLVSLGPVFYWVESRSIARHFPFGVWDSLGQGDYRAPDTIAGQEDVPGTSSPAVDEGTKSVVAATWEDPPGPQ